MKFLMITLTSFFMLASYSHAETKKATRNVAEVDESESGDQLRRGFCMKLNGDIIEAEDKMKSYNKQIKFSKSKKQKDILAKKLKASKEEHEAALDEYNQSCGG